MSNNVFEYFRDLIPQNTNDMYGVLISKVNNDHYRQLKPLFLNDLNDDEPETLELTNDNQEHAQYGALYLYQSNEIFVHLGEQIESLNGYLDIYISENNDRYLLKETSWNMLNQPRLQLIAPDIYVTEHFYHDEQGYLLLRMAGISLYDFFSNNINLMTLDIFDTIVTNVFKALSELHRKGVVHTDIKLENICISPELLEVKIIDYDDCIVPLREESENDTHKMPLHLFNNLPKITSGTIPYLAPEFFRSNTKAPIQNPLALASFLENNYDRFVSHYARFTQRYLKENWLDFFTEDSDNYALAINLLPYLLKHFSDSRHLETIQKMLDPNPTTRLKL